MNFLDMFVRTEWAKALGWSLIHSLWEGAAVALMLAMVLAVARSSRFRYAAGCAAMLALVVGFGVTLYRLAPREIGRTAALEKLAFPAPAAVEDRATDRSAWDASQFLPWLAPVWLAGVLLFQLRCFASWAAAGRLRRIGVCRAPQEWIERCEVLRLRLRMTKPVTLLESCLAEVPLVIGQLRPVVLMPIGLLAGLPAGQIEAILLHELAHIRRGDYLVNLMQTVVEGLLFYHPAVWWISRVIRTERENCCDDLVVATRGDAHEYASALAALAENRWSMREAAMAATGGDLVKRIRRLLVQPEGPRITLAPLLAVGILVVTAAGAVAWQAPAEPQVQTASPYQMWLNEEVPYIITDQERAEFKSLRSDADRAQFIKGFWERRDPTPGTPRNEFQEEHYRRIAYANGRFTVNRVPGWKTDRGRIYIQYGPPDEIDSHPSGGKYERPAEEGGGVIATYPFEQWRYRYIDGIGRNVILEFVDQTGTGDYRMTMDPSVKDARLYVPKAGPTVFRSIGGSPETLVEITPERKMIVTIPIPFEAAQYLITASTVSADGKTNLGTSQTLANSCRTSPGDPGCLKGSLRTTGTVAVPPGVYTFTGVIKDTGGSTEKTVVVHFAVN